MGPARGDGSARGGSGAVCEAVGSGGGDGVGAVPCEGGGSAVGAVVKANNYSRRVANNTLLKSIGITCFSRAVLLTVLNE